MDAPTGATYVRRVQKNFTSELTISGDPGEPRPVIAWSAGGETLEVKLGAAGTAISG